jgi:hypothetical protein
MEALCRMPSWVRRLHPPSAAFFPGQGVGRHSSAYYPDDPLRTMPFVSLLVRWALWILKGRIRKARFRAEMARGFAADQSAGSRMQGGEERSARETRAGRPFSLSPCLGWHSRSKQWVSFGLVRFSCRSRPVSQGYGPSMKKSAGHSPFVFPRCH